MAERIAVGFSSWPETEKAAYNSPDKDPSLGNPLPLNEPEVLKSYILISPEPAEELLQP